jgi:hypothetical protein
MLSVHLILEEAGSEELTEHAVTLFILLPVNYCIGQLDFSGMRFFDCFVLSMLSYHLAFGYKENIMPRVFNNC